ncbi:MAG: hypothetical protein WC520_00645 [Candidatus Paceibacterota bacterium]
MKKIFVVVVVIIIATLVISTGCVDYSPSNPENVHNGSMQSVIDYGHGVYYFDRNKADFGNDLATFIGAHPELELVCFGPGEVGTHGYIYGYFVVFRQS